jgi:hypothetical protein
MHTLDMLSSPQQADAYQQRICLVLAHPTNGERALARQECGMDGAAGERVAWVTVLDELCSSTSRTESIGGP